jgi:tight adherence protein B
MSPDLMMIMVGGLLFLAVAGLGFAFAGGGGDQAKTLKRVQAVASEGRGDRARAGVKRTQAEAAGQRRKLILDNLKANERKARKAKATVKAMLRQAGLSIDLRTFWIISAVVGVVIAGLVALMRLTPIVPIGAGLVGGLGLPRWILGMLCTGRQKKFTEAFPNAIDIVVRGIKSGLPVNDCLRIIARESPQPLAAEFNLVVESVGMGMTINEALDKMYDNMPTAEVRFLSIVMAIQSKTGGNLAEALNNLSVVLRARKMMREKVKAMSGEAVASAFIIGSLPPGIMALISITAPSYMLPLFLDPRGHMLLAGSAIWMSMGIFMMRGMINFKI